MCLPLFFGEGVMPQISGMLFYKDNAEFLYAGIV